MLPPAESDVISANPQFAALYQDLCTNKLDPDGTSKIQDAKALKEREGFAEDLHKARIEVGRRGLVASGLRELSFAKSELPEHLRELVVVIAAVLEGQVAEDDRDLLQDDIAKFKANIEPIAAALSRHFKEDVASLSSLLDLDDPRTAHDLGPAISELKSSITTSQTQLNTKRLDLASQPAQFHALNRQIIQKAISLLEQNLHGSVSRASKAKAEYLSTVAEGMSKKLTLQQRALDSQLYSPEIQEALKAKAEELNGRAKSMRRKVREAEESLEGYRSVGGMQDVAREYAEVQGEIGRVQGEIERLRSGGER